MDRPPLRVLMHPDYLRLEQELATQIQSVQSESAGIPSILVVAPSRRQAQRLRESLAERLEALAGVDVVHFQLLAFRLANSEPGSPQLASQALLEALTEEVISSNPDLGLARYVRGRPSAISSLTRLFGELREGGYIADDLQELAGIESEVALLFDRFTTALRSAPDRSDRPGVLEAAGKAIATRDGFDAVFSYGAYELVGVHLGLLKKIPARRALTFLVPADPDAPAWDYSRRFISRHLSSVTEHLPDAEPDPFVSVALAIRDRESNPSNLFPEDKISIAHVQGPESELNFAARRALGLIRKGVDPHRIAILSRSLEPYAPVAETVFARHGLRVDSSIQLPLTRFFVPRTFLLLLQTIARGFPRRPVIELARSSVLNRDLVKDPDDAWWPGAWDQWSRSFGIIGGFESWTVEFPEMVRNQGVKPWIPEGSPERKDLKQRVSRQAASVDLLARLVQEWGKEAESWQTCTDAKQHAAFLRDLGSRWIRGWTRMDSGPAEQRVLETLIELLDEVEGLEWARRAAASATSSGSGGSGPLDPGRVLEFLEQGVRSASIPWRNPEGVHFLDLMQARGLRFDHVFLIGFNEHLMPRRPREDPFFSDRTRNRLRATSGKPLAVRLEGFEEEQLLFAQMIASVRDSLSITWQRADANGKALSPSIFLRELVRFLPGAPSMREVLKGTAKVSAERVPTHPGEAANWLADRTSLLTLEEAALIVCENSSNGAPGALSEFLNQVDPELGTALEPGLTLISRIDGFEAQGLEYDGLISEGTGWDRPFSQSSLRSMGKCPLTFFFQYVLNIKPLNQEAKAFRLEARELGQHMHRILELIYRDLETRGLFLEDVPVEDRVDAAVESLNTNWDEILGQIRSRMERSFPILFQHVESFWKREISQFLSWDLQRLSEEGHRIESLEASWSASVSLSDAALKGLRDRFGSVVPGELTLQGIPDRVTRSREGRWLISDYKTGGKIEKDVDPREYLRGRRIQLPLYRLMAESRGAAGPIDAEVLGLGPVFSPVGGIERKRQARLENEKFTENRQGFEETLAVFVMNAVEGRFPFNSDRHCQWCDFQPACRRTHYASRLRVSEHPEFDAYFKTQRKSTRKRLLSDVEGK